MKNLFRALRHRNYRIFFSGQMISLVGTWMQQVALVWLIYRLTNSPALLGVVGFASQIPAALLAPVAGVIADRYDRQRLLFLTQTAAMIQALTLAILVLFGHPPVGLIIFLGGCLGLINAFDIPIRQSFVADLITNKADLGNAIALNSSLVNLAKLLGPALAGILIPWIGEGACFLINALSYVAVLVALGSLTVRPGRIPTAHPPVGKQLREGVRYAFSSVPIRAILLLLALISLFGGFLPTLLPIFAKDIFGGGSRTLGFLFAASGLGALLGALYLAGRRSVWGLSPIIALSAALFGLGVVAFSFSRTLGVSALLLVVMGFGVMVQLAASNTVLQTLVDEDKRGRVMSLFTVALIGMAPFGSLAAGALAVPLGPEHTLLIGGTVCLLAAALFAWDLPQIRSQIRPLYLKNGIAPQALASTPLNTE